MRSAPPRTPTLWLAALLTLLALGALRARWTSPQSVDNRTYLEMIVGVARSGLPLTTNGPVSAHRALQARWNLHREGRLWGALPPAFPYLAAPIYRVGGARAVVACNVLLLGVLALVVARLTRRITDDPRAGAAAAWLTLGATPLVTVSFDTSPYPLMLLGITASVDYAVASLQRGGVARREALSAGLCAGVAVGAHPLGAPMLAALLSALYLWPARDEGASAPWTPDATRIRRGAIATLGALIPVTPVAALNLVRFGSPNPVSYGPCVWRSCAETGLDQQGIGAMLAWAAPLLAWAACSLAAWLLARRARGGALTVALIALGALVAPSLLRERALAFAGLAWAFVVDLSRFTLGYSFWRAADGAGVFLGPFVVRAMLQCTPALLLAALAGASVTRAHTRRELALLAFACAGLFVSLALRANLPMAFALGYPFLSLRYVTPALPLLACLAVVATRALPWRPAHLIAGSSLTIVLALWLWRFDDDLDPARRWVLLRGTLLSAALAFALVARSAAPRASALWSRVATVAMLAPLSLGFAVSIAVDLREAVRNRDESQRYMDGLSRQLPSRLALIGYAPELDPALGLRGTRDVEYFDLYESADWREVRAVTAHWLQRGRPVYVLMPPARPYPSPMVGYRFEVVDRARGLYAVRSAQGGRP